MTYDFDHAVPPVRPEPVEPLRTPCNGGPWSGATITHMPDDKAERATNGGVYVLDVNQFDQNYWRFVPSGF